MADREVEIGAGDAGTGPGDCLPKESKAPGVAPGLDYIPAPHAYDVTPEWNGKVFKEIIREGQGTSTPDPGTQVFVHYIGRLKDGSEFDRNSRDKPFSFHLGKREVIQGWEIGVASMKRGEIAQIIIHPELGYGERGSGAKIPPNATLYFEIELLDWALEDVSPNGDGGITRKILKAGQLKNYHPNDGANCTVHLEGYYEERKFEDRTVEFILGEGSEVSLLRGIELVLPKFTEHEKSELIIKSEYAFGADGCLEFGIPAGATVKYIVELLKFTKGKEAWSIDGPEKLICAREFKAKGTVYFQAKKYALAHRNYKKVVDFLKAEAMLQGDDEEERKALLGAAYLNQAQCSLELGNYLDAKHCADEGIVLQPTNIKGWFRKGLANLGLKEPREAKKDFEHILELEPTNKLVHPKINLCNQMIKEDITKERNLYARMMGK